MDPPPPQEQQLRQGFSKSRPSLASSALLDGLSFGNDPVLNYAPLTPKTNIRKVEVDPYEQFAEVVGPEILVDIPVDGGGAKRSKSSLEKVPSFPFQGLKDTGVGVVEGKRASIRSARGGGGGSIGVEGGIIVSAGGGVGIPASVYQYSTPNDGTNGGSSGKSSAWSTLSNRLFSNNTPNTVTPMQLEPSNFTKEYDKLARKHGLQPFPVGYMVEPSSVSVSSVSMKQEVGGMAAIAVSHGPIGKGARILNRLLKRTESTKDISERSRRTLGHPLGQKRMSVSDLVGMGRHGKKDHLRGLHLQDMIRLSGVCEFKLPAGMSPGRLLVPACFHATGTYILSNGLTAPGLFRVSGSSAATAALYDYYQRQFGNPNGGAIVQTTSLAILPTHLTYTVNDVAHLYKALLAGLPGGILGSPAVFQALYSIQSFLHPDPNLDPRIARKIRPRMIALAIATLNLHFRITLICAVFGLLRCVALSTYEMIEESKIARPAEAFTYLKEDSLGVIFGPLLLGDKSDQILLPAHEERDGLLVLPTVAPQPDGEPTKGKFKQKRDQGYVQMQREKARRAALVTEMVIAEWENVVVEMKKIGALEVTRKGYDIPGLESGGTSEVSGQVEPQIHRQLGPQERSERKLKKRKSERIDKLPDRDKPRPPSRSASRTGERIGGPSSLLSLGPAEKKHQYLHIPNSKHMKGNPHQTKLIAGDLLNFPSESHRHRFSKAADMNTAMLPTSIIGEQDVDLVEAGVPVVGLSRLDDLSALGIGRGLEEEKLAQSVYEREHILAQEILKEEKVLVALVPLEVRDADGGEGELVDNGGVRGPMAEAQNRRDSQGRKDSGSGQGLEYDKKQTSNFVYPPPPFLAEQTTRPSDVEALVEDLVLRPFLGVDIDRPVIRQLPQLVLESPQVMGSQPDVGFSAEEETRRVDIRPELRVTAKQELPVPEAPVSLALTLALTTPGAKKVEGPMAGGRRRVYVREGSGTIMVPVSLEQISSPSVEEEERWATPPLGNVTPRPGAAIQILSEEGSGGKEVEQRLAGEGQAMEPAGDKVVGADHSYTATPAPSTEPQCNFSQRSVSASYPYPPVSPPLPSATPSALPLEIRSNSALYSEIRRLKGLLDKKTEEAERVARELEVARKMVSVESVGTLGQLLREARGEGSVWRNRAEWAERRLRDLMGERAGDERSGEREGQVDGTGAGAGTGVMGLRNGEVSNERGGYGKGNGQLGRYGSAPEGEWRGGGRGRGRPIGGELSQRVGSWGVGLEVLGGGAGGKYPGGTTTAAAGRRESQVVTVGPNGPGWES